MAATTTHPPADLTTQTHVQTHLTRLLTVSPIYSHLFSTLALESASPDYVRARLVVQGYHINSKKTLHGSVSCALVDLMGGVAIASHDGRDNTGVSTDMHVTFLGTAKEGDEIVIEGRVLKCGGTLAFTEVEVSKSDGSKVAKGSHTKFVKTRS